MSVLTGDKDLIIGAYTGYNWDQLKFWCNSINMSGFTGKKMIIAYDVHDAPTLTKLIEIGFTVLTPPEQHKGIPIHVDRFFWIWMALANLSADPPEYIITTDVRDVVFQSNPATWLRIHPEWQNRDRLVVASESLKYKDEPWGNQNIRQCFGDGFGDHYANRTIYNVGSFAGSFEVVRDLALMIFQMAINRPIPIVDQAVFNFLLYQQPYKSFTQFDAIDDGWAATLGTTMDPRKIKDFEPHWLDSPPAADEDGVVYNGIGTNIRTCLVHQYDRVPGLKEQVEAKYG